MMKKLTTVGLLLTTLFGGISTSQAAYFQPISSTTPYNVESQYSGKVLTGYVYNGRETWTDHFTDDQIYRNWYFEDAGSPGVFYIQATAADLTTVRYLHSPANAGEALLWATGSHSTDDYKWIIQEVPISGNRHVGFYTIQNVGTGLYISFYIDENGVDLRSEKGLPNMSASITGRREYWSFIHRVDDPIEVLAVPQSGWDVNALNKMAVLNVDNHISPPSFSVTGPQNLSGTAIEWGQYWNDQYFYVINLNALTTPGTYTLSCDGKTATFRIGNDLFRNPYRQNGTDQFKLTDLFDDEYGFVGHWGHPTNWWPKGKASTVTPPPNTTDPAPGPHVYYWRSPGHDNQYDSPAVEITDADAYDAFSGGWDMTDQKNHEWALDGDIIKDLVLFYSQTDDATLKNEILEEVIYGIKCCMKTQNTDGSWRNGILEKSQWVGTAAKLGGGLAAAARLLQPIDSALASQAETAANKAWNYVYPNRFDRTKWAFPGEGKLPDGTTMSEWPQLHRHGYDGAYVDFAVEMTLLNGNAQAKADVEDVIDRGQINNISQLEPTSGDKFPGQMSGAPAGANYNYTSLRAVIGLYKYYDHATPAQQAKIIPMLRKAYDIAAAHSYYVKGPTGQYEGNAFMKEAGWQWHMPERVFLASLFYDKFGMDFEFGMFKAERVFDYMTGCNSFGTSLLLGVGDEFQVNGWDSYQAMGRHVGLMTFDGETTLTSTTMAGYGYMSRETSVGGGIKFWMAMNLIGKNAGTVPTVKLYSDANYAGTLSRIGVGDWTLDQLKALGLKANDLSSIQIPNGFSVTLYDGDNYSGTATTLTSDTASLGSADNTVESIKVSYTPPPIPEIKVLGNSVEILDGDTTPSTTDGTDFGSVGTSSVKDQTFTIYNTGGGAMTVGTVSVSGAGFSVQTQPASSVAAGGSTTFTIRFAPSSVGTVSGSVSFSNDDSDENPFDFSLAAEGILPPPNQEPSFDSDPVYKPDATPGTAYSDSIADAASDSDGGTLSFSKLSGPAWLSVASDGSISGTPTSSDEGGNSWTVRVVDGQGGTNEAVLTIFVDDGTGSTAGGSSFDPSSISGCVLWYDGNDIDGDGTAEGASEAGLSSGKITTWVDKSGSGHNATQSDPTKQAMLATNARNGHAVARFDGADDFYDFLEITDIQTVFWVVKENNGATQPRFLLAHSSTYDFHRGEPGGEIWDSRYANANVLNGTTRLDGNIVDGTATVLPQDDFHHISLVTTGNVAANRLTADRNFGRTWDGDIAEVIIYNQPLSDSDRQDVENYLNQKWFGSTPEEYYSDWTSEYSMGSETNVTDNPDSDDRSNLAEYALAGDPSDGSDTGIDVAFELVSSNGTEWVRSIYPKRKDATDRGLTYLVEVCTNLDEGIWVSAGTVEGTGTLDADYNWITNRVDFSEGENEKYIRLRVIMH